MQQSHMNAADAFDIVPELICLYLFHSCPPHILCIYPAVMAGTGYAGNSTEFCNVQHIILFGGNVMDQLKLLVRLVHD